MARLRYNNAVGLLGASLSSGGTTITFQMAPAFATLTGSDYIPLILSPPAGSSPSSNYEIVHLTAYTAAATTGTIVRGQEGTSGVSHPSGAVWGCGPVSNDAMQPSSLQNGVIGSGDALISSTSINTGTGALTFTLAGAGPLWIADANGLLLPVYYVSSAQTITPPLPVSTDYAVIGVEMDTNGVITLVKGTDTATQLNTGILIAANTAATTSGALRLADLAIWNNAGTYNFSDHTTTPSQGVNWIDRRPWARGANIQIDAVTGGAWNVPATWTQWPSAKMEHRLELTGVPVRIELHVLHYATFGSSLGSYILYQPYMDGAPYQAYHTGWILGSTVFNAFTTTWEASGLSSGSHLFDMYAEASVTSTFVGNISGEQQMRVCEVLMQNTDNGVA